MEHKYATNKEIWEEDLKHRIKELTKEVTIANFDDWQGIYIDGKLIYENHDLSYKDVLNALKYSYETLEVPMDDLDLGHLPKNLFELEELLGENK